jgi:4-diphosphocytidyl-2C-methyl-D-erythritol kinase
LFEQYREEYQKRKTEQEEKITKRRKLQDIEDEAMRTEDLKRAAELCQECMREHKRQRSEMPLQERSSGSGDPVQYAEREEMSVDRVMAEEWAENERAMEEEMKEYAWDDVNDMPLPIEKVREARREEMRTT